MEPGLLARDVEAEAVGASGGEAFLESLDVEASITRLRLQKVIKSFIFNVKLICNILILNFLKFFLGEILRSPFSWIIHFDVFEFGDL